MEQKSGNTRVASLGEPWLWATQWHTHTYLLWHLLTGNSCYTGCECYSWFFYSHCSNQGWLREFVRDGKLLGVGKAPLQEDRFPNEAHCIFELAYFEIVGHVLMPTMGFKQFPTTCLQCQAGSLLKRGRMGMRSHPSVTGRGGGCLPILVVA